MIQDDLIALNDRWRDQGHPYAEQIEKDLWSLRCPSSPECQGQGTLVDILNRAIILNRSRHT